MLFKNHLRGKFSLLLLSLSCFTFANAQIVGNGAINAGFGVDADAETDTSRFGVVAASSGKGAGTDDWFKFKVGSGVRVIDTTGSAAYKAAFKASLTNYERTTFTRGLAVPKLTLSNGYVLLDALYGKDFALTSDSTSYIGSTGGGSAKTLEPPSNWQIGAGNVNGKGDILDFMSHVRRKGETVDDSLFIYVAMAIKATTGAKNAAIELFVQDLTLKPVVGQTYKTLSSAGTAEGRTAWRFDNNGNITQIGDFVLSFDYKSNTGFTIEPRIWVADSFRNSALSTYEVPTNFNWVAGTAAWDQLSSSSKYGYQAIAPKSGAQFAWGVANKNGEARTAPWGAVNTAGAWDSMYDSEQFIELSLNLTTLGVDPASIDGIDPCSVPYRTITYRTRQASSFTSSVEDFAGPYPFWRYPVIGTQGTNDTLDCITTSANLSVDQGYSLAYYKWSVKPGTGGNITAFSNDSSVITVNSGGTYVLASAPLEGCFLHRDTVIVLQDTAHPIAKITILDSLVHNSVYSVILYGGDTAATYARMNQDSALFGPSKGLVWAWTGTDSFTASEQFPSAEDSGEYHLTLTELRNGCTSSDSAVVVLLPAEFGPFHCAAIPSGIQLTWETLSENNASHFYIQKWSGKSYENLGRVEARGFSNSVVNYIFVDNKPAMGPNVYRIALHGLGSERILYSEPCITNVSGKNENNPFVFNVFPNPGSGVFTVMSALHAESNGQVFLYDMSGKVLKEMNLEFNASGTSKMDLSNVAPGIYFLGLSDGLYPQTARITIK